MMAEKSKITPHDIYGPDPMMKALSKYGITMDSLARDLKRGLKAKVTKTLKVKGLVDEETLPKGFKIVSVSGIILKNENKEPIAGDGETIIQWTEVDHSERTTNRIDAEHLTGSYRQGEVDSGDAPDSITIHFNRKKS